MRRRDRTAGAVWLRSFDSDPERGKAGRVGSLAVTAGKAVDILVSTYGYWVELECHQGEYMLRCWPERARKPLVLPPVALSYKGNSLGSISRCALADVEALIQGADPFELSPTEVVRWVA